MSDFAVTKTTTLAGTAEVITVQLPNTRTNNVKFSGVYVDSTVATSFTIEINGAAATTTTLSPVGISVGYTPNINCFSASNVGTGSVIAAFSLAANTGLYFDLANVSLFGSNINQNLTVRSSAITGTVDINIYGSEN